MDLINIFEKRDILNLDLEKYFDYGTSGYRIVDCLDQYWIDDGDCIWWAEWPEDLTPSGNFCVHPLLHRDFKIKENFIAIDTCFTTAKKPLTMENKMQLVGYKEVEETLVFSLTQKLELDTSELRKVTSIEFVY